MKTFIFYAYDMIIRQRKDIIMIPEEGHLRPKRWISKLNKAYLTKNDVLCGCEFTTSTLKDIIICVHVKVGRSRFFSIEKHTHYP